MPATSPQRWLHLSTKPPPSLLPLPSTLYFRGSRILSQPLHHPAQCFLHPVPTSLSSPTPRPDLGDWFWGHWTGSASCVHSDKKGRNHLPVSEDNSQVQVVQQSHEMSYSHSEKVLKNVIKGSFGLGQLLSPSCRLPPCTTTSLCAPPPLVLAYVCPFHSEFLGAEQN